MPGRCNWGTAAAARKCRTPCCQHATAACAGSLHACLAAISPYMVVVTCSCRSLNISTNVGRPGTHPLRCAGKRCDVSICRIRIRHAGDAVCRCCTTFGSRAVGCLLYMRSSAAAAADAPAAAAAVFSPAAGAAAVTACRAPVGAQCVHYRPRQAVEVAHYHCGAAGGQPLRRRQQHPRLGGLRGWKS